MGKVLFTSHTANFVKFNKPYMRWFQEQGWEVHYASLDEEEIPCCDKHFKVQFNRSPYSLDNIKAYFQLKRIIEREKYDLIHCHTPMGGVVTRLAARGARRRGTKVIYTAHGFHFYKGAPILNWLLYYPVERYLAQYTDCLITMNDEDHQIALKHFKTQYIEKIDGVGVDLGKFCPVDFENKVRLREELHIERNAFVLLYTAEFIPRKNHSFLIHCIPELKQEIPNLQVLFAGRGVQLENCKELAKRLEVIDTIRFLGYRRDVDKLCKSADILVSSSWQEGLPINIIEGMACGLPVVCTAIRGQNDVIENEKNGFLYSVNDENSFYNKISYLYRTPKIRKTQGFNNIHDVQKYAIKEVLKKMSIIYKNCLKMT